MIASKKMKFVKPPRGKLKVSKWFNGARKPAHTGIYERSFVNGMVQYAKWNGKYWCMSDESHWRAGWREQPSQLQRRPWRGLVVA